ncbi:zinc-dependent metalloprotease [Xanthomonas fragariae]|uniref:Peptidyl-Asp metalloendopeptidase n=1 Tax=Xanthomonas fragariae TaxID=48664 RepID=A0A1Y6HM51_9XANT|nr:zinc-dependent metalloprotease [Xanthomonas fragariae]AOD15822.1 peptidase [Xanthomonas fragariae]AOD19241.1 peptidase [Xanthomonas fragariae]MBL9198175.1 zinc-dependent metalloprotease [Xanthomonas fragariae]MBL9221178.1 zinc-dependent metalloprotease [Xanthomonas fragariae]MDM7572728.1 zinc-dependent metalloprotease [Xanthomonas fragariae]
MKSKSMCTMVGLIAMCLAGSDAAAGKPLYQLGPALNRSVAAIAATEPALQGLLSAPSTATAQVVQLDAGAVTASEKLLELQLDGQTITATQARVDALEGGESVWYGNLGPRASTRAHTLSGVDPLNSAILVLSGDTITGTIRYAGKLYRLRPLADGRHVLVQVEESRLPQEHPAEYSLLPKIEMPSDGRVTAAAASSGSPATTRVLVVATKQAVTAYGGNMQSLVQLAVAEANQGYINSNVGITLQLARYETTSYTETGNFTTDLQRFRVTNDGYMDSIHTSRNTYTADVGVIVLNNSSYCGLASGIGSTAATAFASVYWDCATGYYSFAHEIGHLQSTRHDATNDPGTSPYAYGHGYRYGNSWRTIMAYDCTSGCPRLNYWSNPNISYNRVPMGNASTADNQRVLVNTKATIAGFR